LKNRIMYKIDKELSNWMKIIKNEEWKYNIISKDWKLISNIWFDRLKNFSEWFIAIEIDWRW